MKITRIEAYPQRYTPKGGPYELSGGRRFTGFESVIVKIDTDEGITGWGEHASSPQYFVSLHGGALAALAYLAPALIGMDPTHTEVIRNTVDLLLKGHEYAKTAIDIACWDILGKASGLPLHVLLGGRFHDRLPILHFAKLASPEEMRDTCQQRWDEGFRHIQIKVGGDWKTDVARIRSSAEVAQDFDSFTVDANAFWSTVDAALVLGAVADIPFSIEQPSRELEDNLSLRRRFSRPFTLDESLDGLVPLRRAHAVDAFDGAMLKTSRFGGVSALRKARDMCVEWDKKLTMEDLSGSEIASAVSLHLAASTPGRNLVAGSLTITYINESLASGINHGNGWAEVPTAPGLGIEMDIDRLGEPVLLAS